MLASVVEALRQITPLLANDLVPHSQPQQIQQHMQPQTQQPPSPLEASPLYKSASARAKLQPRPRSMFPFWSTTLTFVGQSAAPGSSMPKEKTAPIRPIVRPAAAPSSSEEPQQQQSQQLPASSPSPTLWKSSSHGITSSNNPSAGSGTVYPFVPPGSIGLSSIPSTGDSDDDDAPPFRQDPMKTSATSIFVIEPPANITESQKAKGEKVLSVLQEMLMVRASSF